jgi:hypothetical protein
MLTYRSPKVFVQFINETRSFVAPEHIIAARTMKALGSSSGMFELSFKTSDLEGGSSANPVRPSKNGVPTDFWMEAVRPMTVTIISMGSDQDIKKVQKVFENLPTNIDPAQFYASAESATRDLIDRTVVMVGLVEEVAFNLVMGQAGPERVLRVAGRDFSKVLMDDSLRRIARAETLPKDERRIITLGDPADMPAGSPQRSVTTEDRSRLLSRASITGTEGSYWQEISQNGNDSKVKMEESIAKILKSAPSMNVTLDNGAALQSYFNGEPVVSPELKTMTVRATLMLFTYNGPVWQAITQLAPAPLAEVFVDTIGLRNVLHIRRPPFYRPSLMGSMPAMMRRYLEQSRGKDAAPEINKVMGIIGDEFSKDQFASEYKTLESREVIGVALSRSGAAAVSQYQVIPALLMRGEAGEYAASQGVSASYLYDLPTAVRYGSKLLQAVCPWDVSQKTSTRSDEERLNRDRTAAAQAAAATPGTEDDEQVIARRLQRQREAVSQEQTLSASETIRLYYYFRDATAFLNGTLTTQARPDIRIGNRVHLPGHDDMIAYVESVQHVYQYGQPFVSQIAVSRGQPLNPPRGRLVSYDIESPTLAGSLPEDLERLD